MLFTQRALSFMEMVEVYLKDSMRRRKRRVMVSPRSLVIAGILTSTIFLLSVALTTNFALLRASERILSEQKVTSLQAPKKNVFRSRRANGRQVVWLMSFPNSGTSFTSRLVRDATKTVSASNYADETPTGQLGVREPVFPDQVEGPFWIKPEASPEFVEPSKYILTKVCLTPMQLEII